MKKAFDLKVLLLLSLGHMVTDIYQGALPAILPFLKDHLDLSYTMAGVILMASNFTSSLRRAFALKSISVLPFVGFLLSLALSYKSTEKSLA